MKKILSVIIIVSLFSSFCIFAQSTDIELNSDNIKSLTVIVDCLSAAIASNISETIISLPSTTVSNNPQTLLPQRISFFLADPSVFMSVISKPTSGKILASLTKFMTHSISDPVLAKAYLPMADRAYKRSDYLLNGYVNISYPEEVTYESIREVWLNRTPTINSIKLSIDLNVDGNAVLDPLDISGTFDVSVNEEGLLAITSLDTFTINNTQYTQGIIYL